MLKGVAILIAAFLIAIALLSLPAVGGSQSSSIGNSSGTGLIPPAGEPTTAVERVTSIGDEISRGGLSGRSHGSFPPAGRLS